MSAPEAGWDETAAVDAGPRRRGPLARLLRSVVVAFLAIVGIGGSYAAYCGVLIYEGNVHAVENGVLYRSAELSKAGFETVAREYGIKSVLNLRGAHTGQRWYDDEIAAAREVGMAHYDYALSAKRFVTATQIRELLDILQRAPKPVLIHCMSGADRAGLVAAVFRLAHGASAADADAQLSLLYGHFPYLTSRSGAMDDSFWAYAHAVGAQAAKR